MRSWLLLPGLDPTVLSRGLQCGADALVVELASVLPDLKERARQATAAFLATPPPGNNPTQRYVLIHAFATGLTERDLDAVLPAGPDGIVLPGVAGAADIQRLDVMMSVREVLFGLPIGRTRIVARCGDTASGVLGSGGFAGASPRLSALAWSMADLARDLDLARLYDSDGRMAEALRSARSMLLLGAAAAGLEAIDTASGVLRSDRLARDCEEAKLDGFTGKFALSPGQVPAVNALFSPSRAEIGRAFDIVDLFAATGGLGPVFGADGSLLTQRHLLRAQRVLQMADLAVI